VSHAGESFETVTGRDFTYRVPERNIRRNLGCWVATTSVAGQQAATRVSAVLSEGVPMSNTSRRSFLAGAGAVTTVAVTPASGAVAASRNTGRVDAQPFVAHVSDPASGRVVLYVGTDAVVVHDRDLVNRLTRAAGRR
jgi:hypothetical protein